jgi:hypothetical protein
MWIVVGIATIAASVGVLVGLAVEWGAIAGALRGGQQFDLVLVIEAAVVLMIVALLFGATRRPSAR